MKDSIRGATSVALLVAIGLTFFIGESQARVVLATQGPRYHRAPSAFEVIFEGGLALPIGDQQDEPNSTGSGVGAGTGYQLGLRGRRYLGEHFAISPSFHYTTFGATTGLWQAVLIDEQAYHLRTSNLRYALDLHYFTNSGPASIRPYLTGGLALMNNRYSDNGQNSQAVTATQRNLVFSGGLGFKLTNFEFAVQYTWNRFESEAFLSSDTPLSYNWDSLVARFGLSFGR